MADPRIGALHRLARAQGDAVATWQARELGIPASSFADLTRQEAFTPLFQGVWALPGSRDVPRRRVWAALLATGAEARITGEATLWAVGALERLREVALWVPPHARPRPRPGVRHHRGRWVDGDLTQRRDGLPSVPPLRAWTDLAADATERTLVQALSALDRLREAGPHDAERYLARRGRFPGAGRARRAVAELAGELSHSQAERRARRLLASAGLPAPHPRPLAIVVGNRRLGEVDLAYPAVRYGVEIDGPHHGLPEAVERDRARDRRLQRDAAWIIDRFPVRVLDEDPRGFVGEVAAGHAAAAARAMAGWPT